jgi:hypothetical protein
MRLLGANALRDVPRVIFRFLPGSALVSQIVMGREFIKEETLHGSNKRGWRRPGFARAAIT